MTRHAPTLLGRAGPERVAVVANDAGAANLILPWCDPNRATLQAFMAGPALALWHARFGATGLSASIDDALRGADFLVSGTGWSSRVEHDARAGAKASGIPSAAVIDHWVNYRARFERDGAAVLPDEIWVTDPYAEAIARDVFDVAIVLQPNAYLAEQTAAILSPADSRAALFLLEPARADWGRGEPGEFQVLDYFMAHRAVLGMADADQIFLRPHPADAPGKYDAWMATHPGVSVDRSPELASALNRAGLIVGAQTNAMVVALAAGRRVVCALPPWAPPCVLPQPGIIRLADLVSDARPTRP